MSDGFSALLVERWAALASRPPHRDRGFRTRTTTVATVAGPVLVALDVSGGKHLLLPLGSAPKPAPDTSGKAVHLLLRKLEDEGRLGWYVDLALLEDSLSGVFTTLCEDVLQGLLVDPGHQVRVVRTVLKEWRALLSAGDRPLDTRSLSGLHGELTVLLRLLEHNSAAAEWWVGPTGAAHDFVHGARAVEVKTTTAPVGRTVRIHGTDQLDGPPGGLLLSWFRLTPQVENGRSVPELVDAALGVSDDPQRIESSLLRLGYVHGRAHPEHDIRFVVVEELGHDISTGFPRIIPRSLHRDATVAGLSDVQYTVDLDSPPALSARTVSDPASFLLEDS